MIARDIDHQLPNLFLAIEKSSSFGGAWFTRQPRSLFELRFTEGVWFIRQLCLCCQDRLLLRRISAKKDCCQEFDPNGMYGFIILCGRIEIPQFFVVQSIGHALVWHSIEALTHILRAYIEAPLVLGS